MAEKRTAAGLERKRAYNAQYAREHLKRVPLDLQKAEYEELQGAAVQAGESVNGFVRRAIRERIGRAQGGNGEK